MPTLPGSLTRYAWLSIAAALATMALKSLAYWLTGSVGLLADALESLVNLLAALMALAMLTIAERPADATHAYGHGKAEYFSSGFEGLLIVVAACAMVLTAIERLLNPQALLHIDLGLAISMIAAAINGLVARVLFRVAKQQHSITLQADAQHLMTDVWTSLGVIVAVGAVAVSGRWWWDPVIALVVAAHILWHGVAMIVQSIDGLMDAALPADEQAQLVAVLNRYAPLGVHYHALCSRRAGRQRFVSLHVLVPGEWTVLQSHRLLEQMEAELRATLPCLTVFTHLEALDDPAAWDDEAIKRFASRHAARTPRAEEQQR